MLIWYAYISFIKGKACKETENHKHWLNSSRIGLKVSCPLLPEDRIRPSLQLFIIAYNLKTITGGKSARMKCLFQSHVLKKKPGLPKEEMEK